MRAHLHELAAGEPKEDEPWLGSVPDEFEKLTGQWDRDIIAPTNGLSDLMYKSVGIRDARHSLQLGLSMWRLSWITFIFLPLTFTVGFFGMNVDIFSKDENNPHIKWWFIVSIPILTAVLILWYGVKHNLSTQRQNPLRRGVYEALYHELATTHPPLWTRRGPRPGIVPIGWYNGFRWRLLTSWFGVDKLKSSRNYDAATEEFGTWSRTKQYLVRRWLGEIRVMPSPASLPAPVGTVSPDEIPFGDANSMKGELTAVGELLSIATPVAIAELDPTAASRLQQRLPIERLRSLSPRRSGERERPESSGGSDGGMSGVMVEEKGPSEDERSGDEDGGGRIWERRNGGGGEGNERARLGVPGGLRAMSA